MTTETHVVGMLTKTCWGTGVKKKKKKKKRKRKRKKINLQGTCKTDCVLN